MFDTLTDFAMFGAVIFETLAVSTIFVFRRRMPDAAPVSLLGLSAGADPLFIFAGLHLEQHVLLSNDRSRRWFGLDRSGRRGLFRPGIAEERMKSEG